MTAKVDLCKNNVIRGQSNKNWMKYAVNKKVANYNLIAHVSRHFAYLNLPQLKRKYHFRKLISEKL